MFRLIEAGVVAVLIDLMALVIFAPLLVLIERISGAAGTATSTQTLLDGIDPAILAAAMLVVAIAAIATSTKALHRSATMIRDVSRKMDPRNPFSAAFRLKSICGLATFGFAVLLFQPHCSEGAAPIERLQAIRACAATWPIALGALVAFFGAIARAAGHAAR